LAGEALPDSDALLFSLGGRYKVNDKTEVGLGVLYDHKDSRSVRILLSVSSKTPRHGWLPLVLAISSSLS
jgi:long-subunit fatty acid transport protein